LVQLPTQYRNYLACPLLVDIAATTVWLVVSAWNKSCLL
jgi:hypothetical protein